MKGIRKAKLAAYTQQVRKLTKINSNDFPDDIEVEDDHGYLDVDEEFREFKGENVLKKELDHKMPIKLCFEIGLPVEIAASPVNLQYIRGKHNREKSSTSSIDILDLIEKYNKWKESEK